MKQLFFVVALLQLQHGVGVAAVTSTTTTGMDLAKANSEVEFHATAWPMLKINGKLSGEDSLTGNLKLDGNKVSGVAKVKLGNFKTGMDTRDGHMRDKLETTKYPTAELEIKNLVLPDDVATKEEAEFKDVEFTETLSFHGQKKPVKGTVSGKKNKNQIEMNFEFGFPFTEYNIEQPSFAGVTVNKDVRVNVKVAGLLGK